MVIQIFCFAFNIKSYVPFLNSLLRPQAKVRITGQAGQIKIFGNNQFNISYLYNYIEIDLIYCENPSLIWLNIIQAPKRNLALWEVSTILPI